MCSTRTRLSALHPTSSHAARADHRALWEHGISGDVPIVVCRIDDIEDLEIVRQLLHAA